MQLATLERQVADKWEREADELREAVEYMHRRALEVEGGQLKGLSIEDAAVEVIKAHGRPVHYIDLFKVLRVGVLAPEENQVSLYHKLRRMPKLRVSGCHFGVRHTGARNGDTNPTQGVGTSSST